MRPLSAVEMQEVAGISLLLPLLAAIAVIDATGGLLSAAGMAALSVPPLAHGRRWLTDVLLRRQARRVWTLVALLLLVAAPGHAQEIAGLNDVLAGANSISTLPAAKPGVIPANSFDIFHQLFVAVTLGLNDTATQSAGVVIGWVHELFVPMCTIALIFMAIIEVAGFAGYVFWLAKYLVRAGVVLSIIDTAGDYTRWVVTPLLNAANGMTAQLAGTDAGGLAAVFDKVMAHVSGGIVNTIVALPWLSPVGAIESLGLSGFMLACWLLAFIAAGTAFATFLVAYFTLSLLTAVGPIFIALVMAGQLRNWFMGWLNAIASQLLTLILIGITMRLLQNAIDTEIDLVLNTADNVNLWTRAGHVAAIPVVIGIAAVASLCARGISVGIVGGIYSAMAPYAGAVRGMISTGQSIISGGSHGGGASSGGMATPAMAHPPMATPSVGNLAGRIGP